MEWSHILQPIHQPGMGQFNHGMGQFNHELMSPGLLLVPLRGLLIHSHIVCILFSRTTVSFISNIVCEN